MGLELDIVDKNLLTIEEKKEVDNKVEELIEKHRNNRSEINKLVFDSVNALTTSESRISELSSQGSLKRVWGNITGRNRKIQSDIDRNLLEAQYCSQQTIQKLAEQNLMSFELIAAVNNRLNSSIIEIDSEINTIYEILGKFFRQTRSDIIQIENRLDRLEKNINLLNWISSIEYQMIDGIEYSELNDIEKIFRLAIDFFEITNGEWKTGDLLLLKTAINNIGLSSKDNIRYIDFIRYIINHENLSQKLIRSHIDIAEKAMLKECVIISSVIKGKLLENKEIYIVDTIRDILSENNVKQEDEVLKYCIIHKFAKKYTAIDIERSINVFEFVLEILFNIYYYNYRLNEVCENINFEEIDINELIISAQNGIINAQSELGRRYYYGVGIEKNIEEGEKWIKISGKEHFFNEDSDNKEIDSEYEYDIDIDGVESVLGEIYPYCDTVWLNGEYVSGKKFIKRGYAIGKDTVYYLEEERTSYGRQSFIKSVTPEKQEILLEDVGFINIDMFNMYLMGTYLVVHNELEYICYTINIETKEVFKIEDCTSIIYISDKYYIFTDRMYSNTNYAGNGAVELKRYIFERNDVSLIDNCVKMYNDNIDGYLSSAYVMNDEKMYYFKFDIVNHIKDYRLKVLDLSSLDSVPIEIKSLNRFDYLPYSGYFKVDEGYLLYIMRDSHNIDHSYMLIKV